MADPSPNAKLGPPVDSIIITPANPTLPVGIPGSQGVQGTGTSGSPQVDDGTVQSFRTNISTNLLPRDLFTTLNAKKHDPKAILVPLLSLYIPKMESNLIKTKLSSFIDSNYVDSMLTFGQVIDFLPKNDSDGQQFWSVATVQSFFQLIGNILKAGCSITPDSTLEMLFQTNLALQNGTFKTQTVSNASIVGDRSMSPQPISTPTGPRTDKLKLPIFSGEIAEFYEWNEEVKNNFGRHGLTEYLYDEAKCNQDLTTSRMLLHAMRASISKGTLAYKAQEYKDHHNIATFYKDIFTFCNKEVERRRRILEAWASLFDIRLDSVDGCSTYINEYKLILGKLREFACIDENGVIADGDTLLLSILSNGVRASEFAQFKMKSYSEKWTSNDFLEHLQHYHVSLTSDKTLSTTLQPASSLTIRRLDSNQGKSVSFDLSSFPTFPKFWKKELGEEIYNKLNRWRTIAVKANKSDKELKLLSSWSLTYGSENSVKSNDRKTDNKRKRHDNKKRLRRLEKQKAVESDDDDDSSVSTAGSINSDTSHHTNPGPSVKSKSKNTKSNQGPFKKKSKRRIVRQADLQIPSRDHDILMCDSGTDQGIMSTRSFIITHETNEFYDVVGHKGISGGDPLQVGHGATIATTPDGKVFSIIANNFLIDRDPGQRESYIHPPQVRAHNLALDECSASTFHIINGVKVNGEQCINDGTSKYPFFYDGYKTYFSIRKPKNLEEVYSYPVLEITSPTKYEPQNRRFTTKVINRISVDKKKTVVKLVDDYRSVLGYPTRQATYKTLQNTTQLINPKHFDNREVMRDFRLSRSLALRPHPVRDICYHDTFFSKIPSVRKYTCFHLFALVDSEYDKIGLMRNKSQFPNRLKDYFREVGRPDMFFCDNARELNSEKVVEILRILCATQETTLPHHPMSNYAEKRGGFYKDCILKCYSKAPWAPECFWCYCLEFVEDCVHNTASKSLGWRCPEESLFGVTPDISRFRFYWFQPVWYLAVEGVTFPEQKAKPGYFVGPALGSGDEFTYNVLPKHQLKWCRPDYKGSKTLSNVTVLTRGVVRPRTPSSEPPTVSRSSIDNRILFQNRKGEELTFPELQVTWKNELSDIAIYDTSASEEDTDHSSAESEDQSVSEDSNPIVPSDDDTEDPSVDPSSTSDDSASVHVSFSNSTPTVFEEITPIDLLEEPMLEEQANTSGPSLIPTATPAGDPSDNHDVPMVSQTQEDSPDGTTTDDDLSVVDDTNLQEEVNYGTNSYLENLDHDDDDYDDGCDVVNIRNHRWLNDIKGGELEYEVELSCGDIEWYPHHILLIDTSYLLATYVKENCSGFKRPEYIEVGRWARKLLRDVSKAIRRLRLTQNGLPVRHRRTTSNEINQSGNPKKKKKKTKKGRNNRHEGMQLKYGVPVPNNFKEAMDQDRLNNNHLWADAYKKEVASLLTLECFNILPKGSNAPSDHQYCPMMMIYEVKVDLRRKCRLVALGCQVDSYDLTTRSTVVKGITVRLLDIIAHRDGLTIWHGDIGNAFPTATTLEKVYTVLGPEFGEHAECIAIIQKALYGLRTSAARFRRKFSDLLRALGFKNTRFDRDAWMRRREDGDGYDYICTHVDDFKIVARDPQRWLDAIKKNFLLKSSGPPVYYLGANYHEIDTPEGKFWTISCNKYLQDAIANIERITNPDPEKYKEHLGKKKTPLPTPNHKDTSSATTQKEGIARFNHPEIDGTALLSPENHRLYQSIIGILQWLVIIGRPDICYSVSSLSRFNAAPRETHLELALHVVEYLKMYPDRKIKIDSRPLPIDEFFPFQQLEPDFLEEYPDAKEDRPRKHFPEPFGPHLQVTILCDSDHAHDLKTRKSCTGLIVMVGSTPIMWCSKRQSAIATSTYQAEFMALRHAVEEAMSIRYMLRSFGIPIEGPTRVIGDNMSVIQNANDVESDLKKKHVAISYHFVREAIAAGIVECFWLDGKENMADIMTKVTDSTTFHKHIGNCFYHPRRKFTWPEG